MAETHHPTLEEQQAAIDAFWSWWRDEGAELLDRVFTGQEQADVMGLVHPKIVAIAEQLQWEFTPGFDGARHALTVTAAGAELRGVARRWFEAAPDADDVWAFSEFRRPAQDLDVKINYEGVYVQLSETTVLYQRRNSLVDIAVYNPAFNEFDDDAIVTRLGFLLLDKTLGELNVDMWIGAIEFVRETPDDAVPISEFTDVLHDLTSEFPLIGNRNWQVAEAMVDDHPIIIRVLPPLVTLAAPLFETHVAVAFAYDAHETGLPRDEETMQALGSIEDALDSAVANDGRCVAIETGQGQRLMHFYVDSSSEVIQRMEEVLALWDRGNVNLVPSFDPGWEEVSHLRF